MRRRSRAHTQVLKGKSYTLCGTPEYLPPEMVSNSGHSFPVDWWCIGILTHECLTGVTPFFADDPMQMAKNILAGFKPKGKQKLSFRAFEFLNSLLRLDPVTRFGESKTAGADVKALQC